MKQIIGLPKSVGKRTPAINTSATAVRSDPKQEYIGNIDVPWNIGQTIFRFKAARDLQMTDAVIDVKEIFSPSGAPIVIEAWKNGQYGGSTALEMGANSYPAVSLKRLDEIELRICVKGERMDKTEVRGVWVVYCVS
jgi:hypothetical protein